MKNKNGLLEYIMEELSEILVKVYHINVQNYSINGIAKYNDKKCFFKIIDEDLFIKELNGYLLSYGKLFVAKMLFVYKFKKYNKYLLIYEYDSNIKKDDGLLNDVFVRNDLIETINRKDSYYLKKVLKMYEGIYSGKKEMRNNYPSKIFFYDRVNKRLKGWYKELINNNLIIQVNNKTYSINKIIKEIIGHYKQNIKTNYECVLVQGDPNTLNISVSPKFFDLATAGYNPIIGELAITFISTLIYDCYFCPKYHPASYYMHDKLLNQIGYYEPDIYIKKDNEIIIVQSNIKTSLIRKKYMIAYIEILKNNKICISNDIKYYIFMRLLCVFNIKTMSENDYYYSLYMLCYFYEKFSCRNDTYSIMEHIIDEMEVVKK